MNPRVSVVMAVYNGAEYMDRAIPSILAQTYEDFELVIVDDGSTDSTPSSLREVAACDPRVRIVSPGRVGFVSALNHGIEAARGEFIARQDIDDVSYSNRLEVQVTFLDAHPRVGVVGAYYLLQDDARGEAYIRKPPTENRSVVRALASRIPICHTLATFRKQAWIDAGHYAQIYNAEDHQLWTKMAVCGWELANVPEVLGIHYEHGMSFFHSHAKQRLRHMAMMQVQYRAIRDLKLPEWMIVYPLGRMLYLYLPNGMKRFARRTLAGSREKDVG